MTVNRGQPHIVMEFSNDKGEVANLIIDMYEPCHWGYSIITNLDLYLIGLFCNGKDQTEYGSFGNYFYTRLKWAF